MAPSKDKTPPKDSRFVSEEDNTVAKETRSRHRAPGYENTLPAPSKPSPERQQAPADPQGPAVAGQEAPAGVARPGGAPPRAARPARKAAPSPEAPARARAPAPPAGDALALRDERQGDLGPRGAQADRAPTPPSPEGGESAPAQLPPALALGAEGPEGPAGTPGTPGTPGGARAPGQLQLRPSAAAYDRLAGGPAPDRLDGVEEGEGTFLNTRGWKYASYFNRIKRALASEWDPSGAMRARDPSGARFGQRDWMTVLSVRLDDAGGLKEVAVQRSSGLEFLDATAVQAFQKAQPFVNPPRGLADERGEIAFTFSFTFEVTRGISGLLGRPPPE